MDLLVLDELSFVRLVVTGQCFTQKTIPLIGTFGKRLIEAFTHFPRSVASPQIWWTLVVSCSVLWLLLQSPTHHFHDILNVIILKKLQRYISEHANIPWVNIRKPITCHISFYDKGTIWKYDSLAFNGGWCK